MEQDDEHFFGTVMDVVRRYGMKRTTMAELAHGAGVSRQTLYDRFGDKDGVMAAMTDHWAGNLAAALRGKLAEATSLSDALDAYFDIVVWPFFELLQNMPDSADIEKGMGPASVEAGARVSALKREVMAEAFARYLPPGDPSPQDVAAFFEQSSGRAKMSGQSREELTRFLRVLKASVLALAAER